MSARAGDEHHERHAAGEAGDRHEREVHAAPERVRLAASRRRAREVGEDRRLDRLEELQRRAGDQQHVEDEARERRAAGALGGAARAAGRRSGRSARASMISSTASAKPVPCASVNSGSRRGGLVARRRRRARAARSTRRPARRERAESAPAAPRRATRSAPPPCRARPTVWPSAMPTATASANRKRELDSISTSPP